MVPFIAVSLVELTGLLSEAEPFKVDSFVGANACNMILSKVKYLLDTE